MEPRIILEGITLSGIVRLPPAEERHIFSSLRMREGNSLIISDGNGREARCVLSDQREAVIAEMLVPQGEPEIEIHLYPSIAKGERFEWMLQKSVELGVSSITPVLSERCIAGAPSEDKRERWLKIMRGAAEQCGRNRIPKMRNTLVYKEVITTAQGLRLFCYEEERSVNIKRALRVIAPAISLLTGPEGGYTQEEAQLAMRNGWQSVSLGTRILRCETAPLAALAAIQYEFMT